MATVTRSKKTGLTRIQFDVAKADGRRQRRSIALGRVPVKRARRWAAHVDELVAALQEGDAPERETARWLARLSDPLYDKLVNAGLVPPRAAVTLKAFVDQYIKRRKVKESTKTVWRRTRRHLVNCFGADKPLRELTTADAKDFRQFLRQQPGHGPKDEKGNPPLMSEASVRTMCSRAKTFLQDAVDRGLVEDNPFRHRDVPTASTGNRERQHFVSREDAAAVLKACPDAEWRLLFALCRYGGLRCPSETLGLCWDDVDWERGLLFVTAPKTEHHDGKGLRLVPLFPELRPYLERCFADRYGEWPSALQTALRIAAPARTHVIATHRNANHRTRLLKIIKRAGLAPWPKPFQNLRSSRQTELEERFPRHVVCAWIGNSTAVAEKHYLQVTDEHYERALESDGAVPNRAPSLPARARVESHAVPDVSKTREFSRGGRTASHKVGDEGLEPPTSCL